MKSSELRKKFLDFFKENGHTIIPGASLIPEHDPTILFTTAGMHPLVPFLLGEKHPGGKRVANVQKCIRTGDIEDVGDNRHLTFFEMLGNWSFGDYFKKEAISWSWEFLTDKKYLGLSPNRLYVTVFMGDENVGLDQESIDIWKEQFKKARISAEVCQYNTPTAGNKNYRIFPLPAKDNWWGPAGQTGPCGPCTEIFYDVEPDKGSLQTTFNEEVEEFGIMEIWNNVFMEFNKNIDGKFEKLLQKNVDTGMGLERTVSILNGKKDSFDNDLFQPLFKKIEELSGKKYEDNKKEFRIIADHIKAATFIIGDKRGVEPSNVGQGYVVRRLIRRAIGYRDQLGINGIFTFRVSEEVIKIYRDIYPELNKNKDFIINQLIKEEEKFGKTLLRGIKDTVSVVIEKDFGGEEAYNWYATSGVPFDIIKEIYQRERRKSPPDSFYIDFEKGRAKHEELSRTASAGMFKGGLADHSEKVTKYHTATHLLLSALRQVLGKDIYQKGSNITAERLRFDFSYLQKLTQEEIKRVEDLVNRKIQENLEVKWGEMPLEEAKKQGATGVFGEKYGERVKVYTVFNKNTNEVFSKEICGGPHVNRTSELGNFKIIKEESSSAGVRRIRAILE